MSDPSEASLAACRDGSDERRCADAFVFFGATGDLASRKIFPAFAAMARRGKLALPIVGVARGQHDLESLRARIRTSLQDQGAFDERAFARIASLLRFVRGDYNDPETYRRLREALGDARRPIYYLAIPPSMFAPVATGLAGSQCAEGARLLVEKPFGRDLGTALELNRTLHGVFPESSIFRIDHYLGKEPVQNLIYFHLANQLIDAGFHRSSVSHVQMTMAERIGVEGRGNFYEEVGAVRDVVQNHMLQLIACLAMECPTNPSPEAFRDESVRVIKALRPLAEADIVRGQYIGYRNERGVSPDSDVETFAAARFFIDNDRWEGVPFYARTGKRLAAGVTEILVTFRTPIWARTVETDLRQSQGSYLRLRIGPEVVLAQGLRVKKPGGRMRGDCIELVANYEPPDEMLPYERLFNDAIAGETELFAREDMIAAQWRAVDAVLAARTPLWPYEPGGWGPSQARRILADGAEWHVPETKHSAPPPRTDMPGAA